MKKIFRNLLLMLLTPFLVSCEDVEKEEKDRTLSGMIIKGIEKVQERAENTPSKVKKERILSKELPKLDKTSDDYKKFMKQEHRFVLNPNDMSYNEKSFHLQMSIEEAYTIFGQETYSNKGNYSERSLYYWREQGLGITFVKNKSIGFSVNLNLEKSTKYSPVLNGNKRIVVLNGVLEQKIPMHKFLEKSSFEFSDFTFHKFSAGYSLMYTSKKEKMEYTFVSNVPYVSNIPDMGHLSSYGKFSPKYSREVERIQIYLREEE